MERVLETLRHLPVEQAPDPRKAREVRDGTGRYLEKRREHLRYAEFLAKGYPIGSGSVESGNKVVVEARMKGAGMRWLEAHVDPMVALRGIVCSNRWESAWPAIHGQLRRDRVHLGRSPQPASKPPAAKKPEPVSSSYSTVPREKLVVDGCPTANHPWKRFRHHHKPPTSAKS